MRFSELTLMPQSTRKVLAIANSGKSRVTSKVNGKSIKAACDLLPDMVCFEDRSMFGSGSCYSYSDLIALGIKSILVRCNSDRDIVTVKVG